MIPYGRQKILPQDIDAVVNVLKSDFLSQGPMVPEFENAVANYCQSQYAIAMNSATSALHCACMALDIKPNDIIWTTPITFVASANCARYCNAEVDFVDIDSKTYNISIAALEKKLEIAASLSKLPKIVIPVHLAGQSSDMKAIHSLSLKYGFRIIEDASHAIGGYYQNAPIGNCQYSDITIFSFHPVKIITTGEGGMATTNDIHLAKRLARLRAHGITRDVNDMLNPPDGPWYFQQLELGYNYKMTDVEAALGLSQMKQLNENIKKRHAIAKKYNEWLTGLPIQLPWQHPDTYSAMHLYIIRLEKNYKLEHKKIFESLRNFGIGVNLHYVPVYRHPYYAAFGYALEDFPESESYYASAITLPLYPDLTEDQQKQTVQALKKAMGFSNY